MKEIILNKGRLKDDELTDVIEKSRIVLRNDDDELVFARFGRVYMLPGGKIEPNETKEQALIREIKEELDCTIEPIKFALDLEYQYPTFYLKMSCFEAVITKGTPKLLEHNDARWLTKAELDEVDWIPADIEAVNYLKENMDD